MGTTTFGYFTDPAIRQPAFFVSPVDISGIKNPVFQGEAYFKDKRTIILNNT